MARTRKTKTMISKKQYQQLKQLCRSKNPDDVLLVGSVILSLRNRKELSNKALRNLFSIVIKDKINFLNTEKTGMVFSRQDYYNKLVWYTQTKSFVPKLEYKWRWLNGQL